MTIDVAPLTTDIGAEVSGVALTTPLADDVAAEIRALGGEAGTNGDDIADWEGAGRLAAQAGGRRLSSQLPFFEDFFSR